MTALPRFDPFERRIADAVDEIASARRPDYLDDILRQTARTSQRPRWTFLERWLPVDTALSRPGAFGRRLPLRPLIVLALLTALVAGALAAYFGSQGPTLLPYGPAGNGNLLYAMGGDLYAQSNLNGDRRLVLAAEGEQFAAGYSPNGARIAYVTGSAEGDRFMVMNADGTNQRQLALIPSSGNAQAAWSPDSQSVAFVYNVKGQPQLSIVPIAGGPPSVIPLDGLVPWDVAFAPPAGDRLLIRAREAGSEAVGIYTMALDGSDRRTIVEPRATAYGAQFTYSGPVFSPDGKTVAYNGLDEVTQSNGVKDLMFRVHLVNVDGTNDRALPGPSDPATHENWPVFSPDGKSILVLHFRTVAGVFGGEGWVAVMPADGSQPARDLGEHFFDDTDTGISKGWSPDGSRILLMVGSKSTVYSIDPATGTSELLSWTDTLPDWQRVAR